jgi:hypothetical protein
MTLSSTALVTLNQAKSFLKLDEAFTLQQQAEYVGEGDDVTTEFTLDNTPISGTLALYVNNVLQVEGTDFDISTATITFDSAPTDGYPITASYSYAPSSDTFEDYDDTTLELMIEAATQLAEDYTGRAFVQRTITETHYGDDSDILKLYRQPVVSITSVTMEGSSISSSNYTERLAIGRLYYAPLWIQDYEIIVVYVAGYGADRDTTQADKNGKIGMMGVLTTVAHMWENRLGLKTMNVAGVGSTDYGIIGELPEAAKKILNPLKSGFMF